MECSLVFGSWPFSAFNLEAYEFWDWGCFVSLTRVYTWVVDVLLLVTSIKCLPLISVSASSWAALLLPRGYMASSVFSSWGVPVWPCGVLTRISHSHS